MDGLGVKIQHFPLTLLVVLTTLTLPCERDGDKCAMVNFGGRNEKSILGGMKKFNIKSVNFVHKFNH